MALSIRQHRHFKGIPVNGQDDSVFFLDGSNSSFNHLFTLLELFGLYSGCKINLSKTEAIWIGSKCGCQDFPHINQDITWKTSQFKSLGINFSTNMGSLFFLL